MDEIDQTFDRLKRTSYNSLLGKIKDMRGLGKIIYKSDFEGTGWTVEEFNQEWHRQNGRSR